MADDSSKSAGPKKAGQKGRARRSDSDALKALAAKEGGRSKGPAGPVESEELMEENRRSLEAFVRANAAVLDGMAALSAEMLAFGNKRLSANIERSQTLAGCRDVEQAFQVHTEFFESAVRQYLDQANHVMTIMATVSRSLWIPHEAEGDEAAGRRGEGASGR